MTARRWVYLGVGFAALGLLASRSQAHQGHHHNLKVLPQGLGKPLDEGMKKLAKGLGVKCNACHIPDEYDKDDVPGKTAAREFLRKALQAEPAQRADALKKLLVDLKLKRTQDENKIWEALDLWKQAVPGGKSAAH